MWTWRWKQIGYLTIYNLFWFWNQIRIVFIIDSTRRAREECDAIIRKSGNRSQSIYCTLVKYERGCDKMSLMQSPVCFLLFCKAMRCRSYNRVLMFDNIWAKMVPQRMRYFKGANFLATWCIMGICTICWVQFFILFLQKMFLCAYNVNITLYFLKKAKKKEFTHFAFTVHNKVCLP